MATTTTSAPTADRTIPHNLEAEQAVLGACLLNPEALGEALGLLEPGHFFRDAHRRIWAHMQALALKHVEVDTVTLKASLTAAHEVDEVGGPAYIASLTDGVPRSTNVAHYARIVRELAQLRAAIFAANKILADAYDADQDARAVLEQAERAFFEIASTTGAGGGFKRIGEVLPRLMDQIEAWCQTGTGITGLSTGFADIDAMTRGLQPGNLIILAARPSMGKSALALNIAQHVASQGGTVGFVSLEMSEDELAVRALTAEAHLDGHQLQRGRVGDRDWGVIAHAIGQLDGTPLYVDDSPFLTVFDVRTRARRLKQEHGLALLVVDYAQLMVGHEKRENRALELGAVSRMLKAIAKELHVPVIALSQLSRELEKRTDKRPILSDLRESGALEQDADLVLFIYRPEVYEGDNPRPEHVGLAEIIIAKQRNGPIGTVELTWQKQQTRFANRARESYAADQRLPMGDR